ARRPRGAGVADSLTRPSRAVSRTPGPCAGLPYPPLSASISICVCSLIAVNEQADRNVALRVIALAKARFVFVENVSIGIRVVNLAEDVDLNFADLDRLRSRLIENSWRAVRVYQGEEYAGRIASDERPRYGTIGDLGKFWIFRRSWKW